VDKFGKRHRAGYARLYQPSLDERRIYGTEEDFNRRSNLIFVLYKQAITMTPRTEGEGNDWDEEALPENAERSPAKKGPPAATADMDEDYKGHHIQSVPRQLSDSRRWTAHVLINWTERSREEPE